MVGALDSACNRTCAGSYWMQTYLEALDRAPQFISNLIDQKPEEEVFKFGNGGVQQSKWRVRVPMMVGSDMVVTWVSVVPVPSLGLLLGRDFLDGIGCVLSFAKKKMRADHLNGELVPLRQVQAGHFALQLIPNRWPTPGALSWRRVGLDGVLELQVSALEWMKRKLSAVDEVKTHSKSHEHLLTESSLRAAALMNSGLEDCHVVSVAQAMPPLSGFKSSTPSSTSSLDKLQISSSTSSPTTTVSQKAHDRAGRQVLGSMEKACSQAMGKNSLALAGRLALVVASAVAALSAVALPQCGNPRAVEDPVGSNGGKWQSFKTPCLKGPDYTVSALKDAVWLRNRIGLQLAFVEDPLLAGMMAARQFKGLTSKLHSEALQEARETATKAKKAGKTVEAVRELIGPRGGLPHLKGDLIKLAALLNVTLPNKVTVDEIKELVRPTLKAVIGKADASSSAEKVEKPAVQRPLPSAPLQETRGAMSSQQASSMSREEVQSLLDRQSQRHEELIQNVMACLDRVHPQQGVPHFDMSQGPMSWQQPMPGTFNAPQMHPMQVDDELEEEDHVEYGDWLRHGWTRGEIRRMNYEEQENLRRARAEAQHGPFAEIDPQEML